MTSHLMIGLICFLIGIFVGVGVSGKLLEERIQAGVFSYEGAGYIITPFKAPNHFTNGE